MNKRGKRYSKQKAKVESVTTRVPTALYEALFQGASERGLSMSSYVEMLLTDAIERQTR